MNFTPTIPSILFGRKSRSRKNVLNLIASVFEDSRVRPAKQKQENHNTTPHNNHTETGERNMKKDYTHIIIVLDASGSMSSIQDDIKGSFNEFLKQQREAEGQTIFDLFQFSDEVHRLVRGANLADFHDDLMSRYSCSGCTALNDAVCTAIDTVGQEFANMPETERPEHVLCVIITDGLENASREYTAKDVKDRIKCQKEVYSWNFEFLAANQDAFESGRDLGLDRESCMNFVTDRVGVQKMCMMLSSNVNSLRSGKKRGRK